MKNRLFALLTGLFLGSLVSNPGAAPAMAADHAAILMYHRFGEDSIPSTNIRLEQFDAHIAELTSGGYSVLPLPEIMARMRKGENLPDRTVALTADDAYLSAFTEGWPRMKKAGLPFTLFVATEPVESKLKGYLTWDQIRQMKREGVTIGAHSHRHPSLPALSPEAAKEDLETSLRIFKRELGEKPDLFAYPFGEWDAPSLALVKSLGHSAAFGQHSGIAHAKHDMFWLPRFPMNETFGSVERLRQAVNALPLAVTEIEPADVLIRLGQTPNPPVLRFTVADDVERLHQMVCYTGQGRAITPSRLGDNRFEATPPDAFSPPRDRISCTVPTRETGRFRWFGIQFTVQK
jgi:peptidoglycan/xylan/chitin deacetylase (PgdA/CDA1 family)